MTKQREQEGIFTQPKSGLFVLRADNKGWSLSDEVDWRALVYYGREMWEWDEFKDGLLGTLKVPAEYLT